MFPEISPGPASRNISASKRLKRLRQDARHGLAQVTRLNMPPNDREFYRNGICADKLPGSILRYTLASTAVANASAHRTNIVTFKLTFICVSPICLALPVKNGDS